MATTFFKKTLPIDIDSIVGEVKISQIDNTEESDFALTNSSDSGCSMQCTNGCNWTCGNGCSHWKLDNGNFLKPTAAETNEKKLAVSQLDQVQLKK